MHQRLNLAQKTVDGPGGGAEAVREHPMHVVHPEPERRLERHHGVLRHRLRALQPVEADALARRPVVVVPRDLQRPTAVVLRPRGARPLWEPCVAVVVACTVDLLDVAEVCVYIFVLTEVIIDAIYACVPLCLDDNLRLVRSSFFFGFGTDVIFLTRSATSRPQPTTSGRFWEERQRRGAVDTVWRLKTKGISRILL